ncbi:MAG: hypothetical protein VR67_11835 [Peptococcaceae bacterium BRH_c8a]|nr:MAG: hypothetical protein VR67_11835 [Peptococcaceae bacterium BRH_c8a]
MRSTSARIYSCQASQGLGYLKDILVQSIGFDVTQVLITKKRVAIAFHPGLKLQPQRSTDGYILLTAIISHPFTEGFNYTG